MLTVNIQMLSFSILILLAGVALTLVGQYLIKKGKDPTNMLATAGAVLTEVQTANESFGKFLPAPAESIIDVVIRVAQAGVHSAQQLFNSNQLTQDERNKKAFDASINLLKVGGYTPTPELETAIKDMIETGVFVMKSVSPQLATAALATPIKPDAPDAPDTPVVVPTDTAPVTELAPSADTATAAQSLQDIVNQGIRTALQPVATQATAQTLQDIADEAIQAGIKQAQATT